MTPSGAEYIRQVKSQIDEVDPSEVSEHLGDGVVIVDVREAEEVALDVRQWRGDVRGEVLLGSGFLERIRMRGGYADYAHDEIAIEEGEVETRFRADSGEGRWTIEDAMAKDVPTPVLSASINARFYSRGNGDFTHRMLAALRAQFGGHAVQKREYAGEG